MNIFQKFLTHKTYSIHPEPERLLSELIDYERFEACLTPNEQYEEILRRKLTRDERDLLSIMRHTGSDHFAGATRNTPSVREVALKGVYHDILWYRSHGLRWFEGRWIPRKSLIQAPSSSDAGLFYKWNRKTLKGRYFIRFCGLCVYEELLTERQAVYFHLECLKGKSWLSAFGAVVNQDMTHYHNRLMGLLMTN